MTNALPTDTKARCEKLLAKAAKYDRQAAKSRGLEGRWFKAQAENYRARAWELERAARAQ